MSNIPVLSDNPTKVKRVKHSHDDAFSTIGYMPAPFCAKDEVRPIIVYQCGQVLTPDGMPLSTHYDACVPMSGPNGELYSVDVHHTDDTNGIVYVNGYPVPQEVIVLITLPMIFGETYEQYFFNDGWRVLSWPVNDKK